MYSSATDRLRSVREAEGVNEAHSLSFIMVQQCAGCELPIADKFLLKVLDRVWHTSCVQCCDCKCTLTDKCFSREGKLYCRNDFYRRYGTKCSGCNEGISPNDMVRRAKDLVFHIGCFICSYCKRQIATGDELYYVGDGKFVCKEDYCQRYLTGKSNSDTESETKDLSYGLEEDFDAALGTKRRGPRTTIKAKQLEALKATFAATPKPSRSIREKIAQETGLSMRVIQVWFQNRRSKERRIKQQGGGGAVQSSPVRAVSRSARRSRRHRSNSQEGNNTEPQDVNNAHINYQQQAAQGRPYLSTQTYNEYYSPKNVQGAELMPVPGSNFITQSFSTASMDSHVSAVSANSTTAQINVATSSQNGSLFDSSTQPQHVVTTGISMSDVW